MTMFIVSLHRSLLLLVLLGHDGWAETVANNQMEQETLILRDGRRLTGWYDPILGTMSIRSGSMHAEIHISRQEIQRRSVVAAPVSIEIHTTFLTKIDPRRAPSMPTNIIAALNAERSLLAALTASARAEHDAADASLTAWQNHLDRLDSLVKRNVAVDPGIAAYLDDLRRIARLRIRSEGARRTLCGEEAERLEHIRDGVNAGE